MSLNYINFNNDIVSFCQGNSFKRYVRQAINDEMFWHDLFNNMNINNNIDNRLAVIIPEKVKYQLESILPNMMETRYLNYITNRFPGQVAKEINNQFPIYLDNNYQMQQILDIHKKSLRQQLESNVREILDRICLDPKYQEVVNSHLATINHNAKQKIDEIESNAEIQSNTIKQEFNREMVYMKNHMNQNLSSLTMQLSEMASLKKELIDIKEKQKNEVNKLQWIIAGTTALCLTAISIVAIIKIN